RDPAPRGTPAPSPHAVRDLRRGAMARACRRAAGKVKLPASWGEKVSRCSFRPPDGAGGRNEQRDAVSLSDTRRLLRGAGACAAGACGEDSRPRIARPGYARGEKLLPLSL